MSRVALIPARGGSKRLPGKNLRSFAGKPIIEYSIDAALSAASCDRVIVSTDDDEIAAAALAAGAEVPFIRPADLAGDHTTILEVVLHLLDTLEPAASELCIVLATAPFLTGKLLDDGYERLIEAEADAALGVTTFPFPIWRGFELDETEHLRMIWPDKMFTRSQDLPEAWHDAGQFCWVRPDAVRDEKALYLKNMVAVPIPRHAVQDIDTEEDWRFAEALFAVVQERGS